MSLFLGIDGGGTKTTCALGDETTVLAISHAGACNVVRVGEAQAVRELQTAISHACTQANKSPLRIRSAFVGAAGAGNPQINAAMRRVVRQVLPNADVAVEGDTVIAHEASLQGQPGVVVISGTGSIAFGRNEKKETARAGGWGFAISDEGSAHWIGRTAIGECMHAFDAQRPTALLDMILSAWSVSSREAMIPHANSTPPPNWAELFPVVSQAGDAGDPVAIDVLARAGTELAKLALTVSGRLWQPDDKVQVGVAGSVFAHCAHVRRAFNDYLQANRKQISVCFKIVEPVLGALALARRSALAAGAL